MKKNISINISGIIFHIEEDGYEMLRKYLDSVNRYFSNFEDSAEILADIEGRMAEIFLSKLSDTKQVITLEDVTSLMGVMGSVSDFKAAEENEFSTDGNSAKKEETRQKHETGRQQGEYQSSQSQSTTASAKRLYRDQKRKILGGVCSGLASYFNVEPVWIRLLFALLFFAYGSAILVYIILWIAVPGSFELEEPTDTKRMYRDPENKVLGGVAAGLAAYFGTDVAVIRIILLISIFFFGTGILLYIVLWIVLPEAKSITDRIQMQGDPVTLSTIESNVKKNINEDSSKEESIVAKILLFPFRLLAAVIGALGRILVPLGEVIRVAFGIFIALMAIVILFSIIVTGAVLVGLIGVPSWFSLGYGAGVSLPVEPIMNSIPSLTVLASFLGAIIPSVFFLLLGISIIVKRYVFSPVFGWSLFGLWLMSAVVLSFTIPNIVYNFKQSGEYRMEKFFEPTGSKAVLRLREKGLDDYPGAKLTLKGYEGKNFKLVQRFESQGSTAANAIENAKMITYGVELQDSVLLFDSNIQFQKDAVFRAQSLDMTLYIPYEYPFVMDEGMSRFISQYVDWNDLDNNTWKMTEKFGLECVSCENGNTYGSNENWTFDEIEVSGYVDVTVNQSSFYSVEIMGGREEKEKYTLEQVGNTLIIKYREFDNRKNFDWKNPVLQTDEVEISISMPSLEKIEAKGAGKITFHDFTADDLEIELLGAFRARGNNVTAHHMLVAIKGASELELTGEGNNLEASIAGASKLKAYDFEVDDAVIETLGVSSARVTVTGTLDLKEGVGSSITYRGNPTEVRKD
jgi:phage shock protein PspC (stress-responsive transcriptional regulator)